jgi:hypothetical protein
MRKTQTVTLDKNAVAIVKEVSITDIRYLLSLSEKISQGEPLRVLTEHFDELLTIIHRFCELPKDYEVDELSGSELVQLWNGFIEVNSDFLAKAGALKPPPTTA